MLASSAYVAFFAIFTACFTKILLLLDINKRVYNHVPGECSTIPNLPGGGGFDSTSDGTLFMTVYPIENNTFGHLFTFSADNKTAIEVVSDKKMKWNPSTLSIISSNRQVYVHLLNEKPSGKCVEMLTFNERTREMKHLKTAYHDKLRKANDIAAIRKNSFFATIRHYFDSKYLRVLEGLLPVATGSILLFDGKTIKEAVPWISNPTGIVFDKFRKLLIVGLFSKRALAVFHVREQLRLDFSHEVKIGCAPQSLWKDIDGSLVVTCQPVMLRYLFSHFIGHHLAPSQVLRIQVPINATKTTHVSQMYANDGATISGAHAAARAGKGLVIANDKEILHCQL